MRINKIKDGAHKAIEQSSNTERKSKSEQASKRGIECHQKNKASKEKSYQAIKQAINRGNEATERKESEVRGNEAQFCKWFDFH